MFCHKCGTQIAEGAGFCHKCGTKTAVSAAVPQTLGTPVAPSVSAFEARTPAAPVQTATAVHSPGVDAGFREFVDNHVRATTKFQSAEDLIKNSKPMLFAWICSGAAVVLCLPLGTIWYILPVAALLGFTAIYIASGIMRTRYGSKVSGNFSGPIDVDDLIQFLNRNMHYISPNFHEWDYYKERGLGIQSAIMIGIANAVGKAMKEVEICGAYGAKKKKLTRITIRPNPTRPESGEMQYFVDAVHGGFMLDYRAARFYAHSCFFKTAPILQAAMKYYLQSKGVAE